MEQDVFRNPFGMDEACPNCPELVDCRERIVHGYGDVDADFLFVGEAPSAAAERAGVPFVGDEAGRRFQSILGQVGLNDSLPDAEEPELDNAYLTYLARCRHPDRPPTDGEIGNCEPYLNAEIRSINPEIIVPVGARALETIAEEYTTRPADDFAIEDHHATPIRGRGFELVPMIAPAEQTDERTEAFVEAFLDLLDRDYRQTKGRRGR